VDAVLHGKRLGNRERLQLAIAKLTRLAIMSGTITA